MASHNKAQYDRFGVEYHAKRSSSAGGFYNDFIDLPALERLLKADVAGRDVLDLGCGSGLFSRRLAAWGANVRGADQSATMIGIARRENPGIPFYRCGAGQTPFRAGTFDVVASALMIHYLKDPKPAFREVRRVLRPAGLWVFSFHHPFNETLSIAERAGELRASAGPYFHRGRYEWSMESMRLRSYHHTFEEIVEGLRGCGFAVERLLEPRPSPAARKISPEHWRRARAYPFFCAIRARKT